MALGVAVLVYLGLRLVASVVVSRLARFAKATDTGWDDIVTGALQRTKGILLLWS